MTRYIPDGPPIPIPSRDEMLAASLPFELRTLSEWRDVRGVVHREPITVRFASEDARRAWATPVQAEVNHALYDARCAVDHGDDSDPGDEDRR